MHDVGDTVTLAADCFDAAGALANATTAGVTVTLPDGTGAGAQSPANPPAITGKYTHPYVATTAGRHVYRWTFTGVVPDQAHADAFNVVDSAWTALVGLGETKRHLNIDPDDTTDDEELRGFILSCSAIVEDIVGAVARRSVTETYSGGSRAILLKRRPVVSVTTVVIDGVTADAADYRAAPSGVLHKLVGSWPRGFHNVTVTYAVGRPVVPANLINGTKDLVRVNWRPQAGGNYSAFDGARGDDFGAGDEEGLGGEIRLGFFVPNTVMQRLQPQARGPHIA